MKQIQMTKKIAIIRSIVVAFLLVSGFSASAQFDLDIEVTNACNGPNSGAIEITILNDLVGGAFTYDWAGPSGFTSTTAVGFIATPEPGTYTVMVTRNLDGAMRNATIDVLQSAVPLGFNPAVVTGTSCNGGDGAITITGANGTGPYVYAIIPYPGVPATVADFGGFVPNNGVFTGLAIDQYSVAVRDALGCIEIQDQIAVNQIASTIGITLDGSTNATCNLGNDGGIAVSGNGGVGNYTFSIIPGGGGSTEPDFELAGYQANGGLFPNLPANTYDLAVKDDNGCVAIRNGVAITEPDPIVLTQEVRFTTCDSLQIPDLDDGNGRINILTTLGGTPPYTYEWEGPNGFTDTGLAINNLIAGDYAVTVTDGNLCERQFPFVIYNGFELQALPTNVTCKEEDDGEINLNIIWDELRDAGDPNNLPHGQPGINQFVQWDKIELGVAIPQIDVDNDNNITGLGPGTYVATVTDHFNCVKRDTVEITEPAEFIDISNVDIVNVLCRGESTGSITMTATGGGLAGYEYSIDAGLNFQQEPLFEDLPSGDYDLVVQDLVNGCTDTETVNISEPGTTYSIDAINTTDIACFDDPDIGQAEIVIGKTDPSHPITDINWYNIDGSILLNSTQPTLVEQLNTLAEGAFVIEVIDGFGCVKTDTFQINRPEEFRFVLNEQDIPCPEGGAVELSIVIEGGTAPYNYVWTFGGIEVLNESKNNTTSTLSRSNDPANAGDYLVTVTDARNCEIQQPFNIGIPDPIIIIADPVIQNACIDGSDGSIDITVTGGTPLAGGTYQYSWFKDGSTTVFSTSDDLVNLERGEYRVDITDANGCAPVSLTVDILDPTTTYQIDTVSISNVVCNGDGNGVVQLGISFLDPGGSGDTHPTAPNEFTYTWSKDGDPGFTAGNTQVINNLGPGVYRVSVNDNFPNTVGCVQEASFEVREFNTIELNEVIVDNICPPGPMGAGNTASITLSPTGGFGTYMYSWTKDGVDTGDTGPIIDNLEGGFYEVRLEDDLGCVVAENFTITTFTDFVVTTEQELDVTCNGADDGSISIDVAGINGTVEFLWTLNGSFFSSDEDISNLAPGLYELTVTDVVGGNDCTVYSESYTITEPDIFDIVETITNPVCNSGMDGSISIELNDGAPVDPSPFELRWYALPDVVTPIATNVTEILSQPVGDYRLEVEYDLTNNCIVSEDFVIVEFSAINPNFTVEQLECRDNADASIALNPLGGDPPYNYQWFKNGADMLINAPSISAQDFGTYTVVITDDNGCGILVDDPALVIQEIPAFVISENVTQISCNDADDGEITVDITGGTGALTYSWLLDGNVFSSASPTISGLALGSYELTVIDANDCEAYNQTHIITEPAAYVIVETIDDVTCNGGMDGRIGVVMQNGPLSTGFTYSWTDAGATDLSPGVNTSFIDGLTAGQYNLTVTTPEGCSISESYDVIEYDPIFLNPVVTQLTCPNVDGASIVLAPVGGNTASALPSAYTYVWERNNVVLMGETDESLLGIGSGNYRARVTDDSGCEVVYEQTINFIPDYTVVENITQITCIGADDGSLEVLVSGGLIGLDLTYQWELNGNIVGDSPSISNLGPGDYDLTISNANGCLVLDGMTTDTKTYTIDQPVTFTVTPTVTDVTCDEINDGSISLNLTNVPAGFNAADFTYTFTRLVDNVVVPSTLSTAINLESGLYRVDITHDSFSTGITSTCTESFEYEVINFEPITITPTVVPNSCPAEEEGEISIVIDGGSGPYNIEWRKNGIIEGPQNVLLQTDLGPGQYDITVTDQATTCAESTQISIELIDDFIVNAEVTDLTCQSAANGGADNGSISLGITGGTGDLTYLWVALADGEVLDDTPLQENLAPGDYQVTVRDENLCVALNTTYTINEPPSNAIVLDDLIPVRCNGEMNGSIEVSFQDNLGAPISSNQFDKVWYSVILGVGGAAPTLTEIIGQTGATLSGRPAGDYRIIATENNPSSNNCVLEMDFTIVEYDQLTIDNIITSQLSCDGFTDGSIQIEVSGGNAPTNDDYTVQWTLNGLPFTDNDPSTNLEIINLGFGSYKAVVLDLSGCSITENEVIVQHEGISVVDPIVTQISCFNTAADGSITIGVTGGTAPYSFDWSKDGVANFSSDQNLTDLEPGTYSVLIDDVNTCPSGPITSQDFIIETPPQYEITGVIDNETCLGDSDGSIDITINVVPGSATTLNASLFDYTWYYNNTELPQFKDQRDINGLTAGTYRIDVIDNTTGACAESMEFELVAFEDLQLNSAVSQITCPGEDDGTISIDPIGGSPNGPPTIEWYQNDILLADSTGNLSIRGLSANSYRVVVTDAEGCATDERFTINELADIVVPQENVTVTQIKCIGDTNGEISINIEGGTAPFGILWQKDGSFFTEEQGVIDADTAESTISNLTNGVYTVSISDANSCTPFTASYTIDDRTTTFTGGVGRPQAITCFNASDGILNAVIIPDAGHPTDFEIEWYKDDATVPFSTEIEIDQLGPGTYRSEVTDAFGCMKEASVTLINPDPIFARAAVTELICNDAQTAIIQLDPVGGYGAFTTTWSEATIGVIDNPGFRLASLGAGEYTISLMDTVGCVKDTTILILNPIAINLISTVQNVDCQGSPSGSIDLNVTEGTSPYTFQWRRDSTLVSLEEDLSEIVAGNYTVRVEDSNGCVVNSDTIQVTEPEVSFTIQAEINRVTCNNGTDGSIQPVIVEEGGTSTYRFNWYKDSVLFALDTETIVGISPGLYTVEVEDANGCVKTRNYELINPPVLDVNHVTEDLSCFRSGDGAISVQAIGGYGNYSYEWSTGGEVLPDTTSRLSNLEVGIYQCVITDAEGCDITRRFQVNQPLPIIIDFVTENNTCPGPYDAFITPTVTGGRPPYTFLWERNGEPFTDSLAIDSLPPAEYVLTVTDSSLCDVKTDPIIIEAPDPLGFNFLEFVDNLCPTTENGMISVQGIGGTSPYVFSFDSSAFDVSNDFFGLAKDKYPLSVMDDVGCVTDTIIEINHQYDLQPDFTYSFQELAIDYDISFEDQTVGPGLVRWFWDFGDERASPEQDPVTQFEAVGEYIVSLTVENEVQCVATFSDTLQVEQGYVFTIPSGFSPNNDGLNDFFRPVFDDIIDIRTNIVDRNGEIVFTSNSREEFWDGRVNGDRLPQGPYYYEISYTSRAGKTRFQKGKVLLLR
ncbi:MAG: gliding motility-associated C-terminal domain-containing protein [Cyclobacteriaceae bacterium]